MAATPFTVEQFGALNITSDAFEVGQGARDLKNVRLDYPGKLLTRGGFDTLNSDTQSSIVGMWWSRVFNAGPNANYVYAIRSASLRRYAAGLATYTDYTSPTDFATSAFSGSAAEFYPGYTVFARTNTTLLYDSGVARAAIAGSPSAKFLTVSGIENRLVAAHANIGLPASDCPGRVHFSAPNDLATWGVTDYVDLWPNDGQPIRAAVTYRDSVFVFKDRRFAVFYGESTDPDGGALFNYRPVDVGIGCAYDHGAAVGPDGVYFIATDGIYRTQGDSPTLVSGALQAMFDGATGSEWNGPTAIVTPRLFAAQDRLYFINDSKVFSFHYASGAWTMDVFTPGVQFMAQTPTEKPRSYYFLDGSGKACAAGDSFADDDGTAISWSYTSGRYSLADPGDVVVTRESSVVGSGNVKLGITTDLCGPLYGSTAATLGTAPATAEGWPAGDQEGTWFQHTLSGTGPASVSRLTHYVSSTKAASIR